MKRELATHSFSSLLTRLDVDRDIAGQRYEELRRVLTRFFEWRNTPFPEDQTDETLDRVAKKIGDGIEIENINAYCYEVARLVALEALKEKANRHVQLAITDTHATTSTSEEVMEKEAYLSCLESCLEMLPAELRHLILEYYQDEKRNKIDNRKTLAARLGLNREALANRAQRVRNKLEICVMRCAKKKTSDMNSRM